MTEFRPGETHEQPAFAGLEDWGPGGEPEKLGSWILGEQLGAGGWGVVYRARHEFLGSEAAVKVLRPALAAVGGNIERFLDEGRALKVLNANPHIVRVDDLGRNAQFCWMVMELVEGHEVDGQLFRSLGQRLNYAQQIGGGGLPEAEVLGIARDVLAALGEAHGRGLVHRDIKPANILLDSERSARLADFGLVKLMDAELAEVREGTKALDRHSVTGEAIRGTLSYMSPEQEDGRTVDGRSDLYSLGVVLYQALTGKLPRGRFKLPGELGIACHEKWDALLDRALEEELDRRWPSAQEMLAALEAGDRKPEPEPQQKAEPAPISEPSLEPEPELLPTEATFTNGIGQQMIWVKPGSFRMGDLTGNGGDDELPVRTVELSGYYLGATQVTQGQWEAVMKNNPSYFPNKEGEVFGFGGSRPDRSQFPVETVSWHDALEFCRELTEREQRDGKLPAGYAYVLPTEAEWENACRAGTEGDWAGDLDAMGWYRNNSGKATQRVWMKKANAWGFYDMHGNVWEWCLDWYQDSYAGLGTRDPVGPRSGSIRVVRGGSWLNLASNCRSAYRFRNPPDFRFGNQGFRVALSSSREP